MLDRRHRLTSSAGFSVAIRRGRRAGSSTLVVHLDVEGPRQSGRHDLDHPDGHPDGPRVGLVVARSVGNAVTRNRVRRRLRHLARERLSSIPDSGVLVVRALPPAAVASYSTLGRDLDSALQRALAAGTGRRR